METEFIRIRTFNCLRAELFGYKPCLADKLIMMRSHCTHTEIQFSDSCGGISFSATTTDGCKCARFKMIGYSHPRRWDTVTAAVTGRQEEKMFEKACQMADIAGPELLSAIRDGESEKTNQCYYGPGAVRYDLAGTALSFISRRRIWRPHDKRVWCTEAAAIVLLEVFGDLLTFPSKQLRPDDLKPDMLDMIARDYFSIKAESPGNIPVLY